jgi:hypothetical protein
MSELDFMDEPMSDEERLIMEETIHKQVDALTAENTELKTINSELDSEFKEGVEANNKLRSLIRELIKWLSAYIYSDFNDPHEHCSGCPKSVMGIHHNKQGECHCFDQERALISKAQEVVK